MLNPETRVALVATLQNEANRTLQLPIDGVAVCPKIYGYPVIERRLLQPLLSSHDRLQKPRVAVLLLASEATFHRKPFTLTCPCSDPVSCRTVSTGPLASLTVKIEAGDAADAPVVIVTGPVKAPPVRLGGPEAARGPSREAYRSGLGDVGQLVAHSDQNLHLAVAVLLCDCNRDRRVRRRKGRSAGQRAPSRPVCRRRCASAR